MAQLIPVCIDGEWKTYTTGLGTQDHVECTGTLAVADWPPPSILPPLSIEEATELSLAFIGLHALVWVFVKLRSAG